MLAHQALERFATMLTPGARVLDVGSCASAHSRILRFKGSSVKTLDRTVGADIEFDLNTCDGSGTLLEVVGPHEGVWVSHVLEHLYSPIPAIRDFALVAGESGLLCITVPPLKHEIVGGHVNLYNEGLLCYHAILAGLDLREAHIGVYDYNLSLLTRVKFRTEPTVIRGDQGDIDLLGRYFPLPFSEGKDGRFGSIRWDQVTSQ